MRVLELRAELKRKPLRLFGRLAWTPAPALPEAWGPAGCPSGAFIFGSVHREGGHGRALLLVQTT